MRNVFIVAAAVAIAAAPVAAEAATRMQHQSQSGAPAQKGMRTGTLACDVSGSVGMILGSSREVACTYQAGGHMQRYVGTIDRVGLDVGVTSRSKMVWSVVAPSREAARAGLQGSYSGASMGASAVYGASANVLVGGSSGYSLQPVNVSGQKGVNLAAGVSSLSLAPATHG